MARKPVRSRAGGKSGISRDQIDKFKRQSARFMNETSREYSNEVTETLVKAYTLGIKSRLKEGGYEQAKNDTSKRIVDELVNSIHYKEAETYLDPYFETIVPVDENGIMLYLEYGTGLKGEKNSNGYGESNGWNYAINRDDYRSVADFNPYKKNSGIWNPDYDPIVHKLGFVFTPDKDTFITKDDVYPVKFISRKFYQYKDKRWRYTKSYVRKDGTKVRGYRAKIKNKNAGKTKVYEYDYTDRYKFAWSEGIKPIAFVGRTKKLLKKYIRYIGKTSGRFEFKIKTKGGKKKVLHGNIIHDNLSKDAIKLLDAISNGEWSKGGAK